MLQPAELSFTRLTVPAPTGPTEPWSLPGLFLGSYGSHGPELISIQVLEDGEIVGTKVREIAPPHTTTES